MLKLKRNLSTVNVWPGYVDVLATMLIVTVFTMMISTLTQLYFNDVVGKKTSQINLLDKTILDIGKQLSLTTKERDELKNQTMLLQSSVADLDKELSILKNTNEKLNIEIKKKVFEIEVFKDKFSKLSENNELLINRIKQKNQKIGNFENQIKIVEDSILNKNTKISSLEKNIAELNNEIKKLSLLLDQSEEIDKKNRVIIKDLGRQLNTALAGKVQELSEFQSIFLRKLKKNLSNRQDIVVSGDRFILPSEIFFQTANDDLEEEAKLELNKIALSLKEISLIIPKEIDWVLRIDGHTDRRPILNERFQSNWHLSSSRAIKIVNYLIDKGIPANRLIAAGFGQFSPLVNKNTEEAFKKNRRIEIKLTTK